MKKLCSKKIIFVFIFIMLVFVIVIKIMPNYNQKKEILENNKSNNYLINSNAITMMYETEAGSGEYQTTTDTSWPQEGYVFNERLSGCENGGTLSWNSETNKVIMQSNTSDRCYVYFDVYYEKPRPFYEEVATWNINTETPNFTNTSCSEGCGESTVGIYKTDDDLGTSYYFRGDVENNYVLFAGFYWRIIRVNGDGTIRIIYDGSKGYLNGEEGSDREIGTTKFNSTLDDNAYVGYMYGTPNSSNYANTHANINDSTIKTIVDNWYKSNIYDKGYSSYIADAIYCNDRSLYEGVGYGTNDTEYNGRYRMRWDVYGSANPTLKCSQTNDRFSVNTKVSNVNANGDLNYPVGLISFDEVSFAGGTFMIANTEFYLSTGEWFWTMTPSSLSTSTTPIFAGTVVVRGTGSMTTTLFPSSESVVRPVISLKRDVQITGDGTINNPYTVV